MTKKNYVALHNHSHYSLLDGYATIDEYIKAAKDQGMIGIGLADHGTASGLYKFITRAQDAGLIPVPGLEFYMAPENPLGAKVQEPVYYGPGGRKAPKYDVPGNGAYTHITVFAYNNKGLENLFKLTSISWQPENYYFKPRIDTNTLAEYSEGLIVTTGCPSSEVSRRFLLGQDEKAYEYASRLKSIFGDNMYVEVMNHEMDDDLERILLPKQIKLARDLDIPMIATNDSHYAFKEDAEPHERILSIQTKTPMTVPPFHKGGTRFAFSGPEYYIKSYDEMYEVYPEEIAEEALANTIELTMKCKDIKLEYDPHLRPEIDIPEGHTPATYLQELILEGFKEKRKNASPEVIEESIKRLRHEFEVIHSNDFITYFLVVHDYIKYAHDNGILVGAGRGSVGGSEIAYVLDISNTDPIKYDLLFERFLSPGRGSIYQIDYVDGVSEEISVSSKKRVYMRDGTSKVKYVHEIDPGETVNYGDEKKTIKKIFVKQPGSAPDVDTDFHTEGRDEVIEYVTEKYGKENVAHIVTFGTFKAKRAFKAMCTAYRIPFAAAQKASDAIPDQVEGEDIKLYDLMDPSSPRYNEGVDFRRLTEGPEWAEVVEMAAPLDGRISETGVHPCGVIISNQPLAGIIPLQVRQRDNTVVTQWEYPELEALGLIKMDFLGLELLNTIQQTLDNIKLTNESTQDESLKKPIPDMRELVMGEMNDPKTYETLKAGNTIGIFQLSSPGVRDLLRRAQPESFMDIATITALYRPGPMSTNAHLEWADRKTGAKEIEYIDPGFEGTVVQEILEDTSGILVFQEQLMQIVTRYAGMSSYEADLLRKAMGKKDMNVMLNLQPKFIEGAIENGSTKKLATKLWDTMVGFAQYGFNKSHSVSYAINIYQAVYLKTHYPSEFMAALIQQGFGNPSKVAMYLQEAQRMGLRVGPVDINTSQVKMAATSRENNQEYDIVYGFLGVKQVNEELSEAIVKERNENGPYSSVADFVKRITRRYRITSSALSHLAIAGAFDKFGVSRKLVSEKASMIIQSGQQTAQMGTSLFDMMGGASEADVTESIELTGEDFDYNERIKLEADSIGLFVSGHPTARLGHMARMYSPTTIRDIRKERANRKTYNILATITQIASKTNRSGRRSIQVMIDDGTDAFATYMPRNIVNAIEKGTELRRIREAQEKGQQLKQTRRSEQLRKLIIDDSIIPMDELEKNEVYRFEVRTSFRGNNFMLHVSDVERLYTAPDGSLPYEVKVVNETALANLKKVAEKYKGDQAYIRYHKMDGTVGLLETKVDLSLPFILDMEKAVGRENVITEGI